MTVQDQLRLLPSVDALLRTTDIQTLIEAHGHDLAVEAMRATLDRVRAAILAGAPCPAESEIVDQSAHLLAGLTQPSLYPVINATGVIIHTNLGRAPLCDAAIEAMVAVGRGYSNLEYDLDAGQRGSRYTHASALLCRLTGAEAALVVNNNAGAVLLALTALARDREVVISRGQLVEIGGGFRIPDVMRQSGARLVEVGATNRTHLRDYEQAIGPDTRMLMVAHQSNFRMTGFATQVPARDLVTLGHARGLLVYEDLGSGTLLDTQPYGFSPEPTVQSAIAAGIDLVSFSGDKLLGAPQSGILIGREEPIAQLRHHPLTRALRVDKTTLAGLQATLLHYVRGDAEQKIPVWRMISMPTANIRRRALRWASKMRQAGLKVEVIEGRSAAGGGSLPGDTVPSQVLALATDAPDQVAAALRAHDPPVIVRIENDLICLDPRTVLPEQDKDLLQALLDVFEAQD